MDFVTIGQYFHKLSSAVLMILLVPIVAFVVVYLQVPPETIDDQSSSFLLYMISTVVIADLVIVFLLFNKKIKSVRNGQGLRAKLEKYFSLTIVRYILIAAGSLFLAYGFYVSRSDLFTGMFVLNLVLSGGIWPTPSKVANDLKLRGDEREMVYYKKDTL